MATFRSLRCLQLLENGSFTSRLCYFDFLFVDERKEVAQAKAVTMVADQGEEKRRKVEHQKTTEMKLNWGMFCGEEPVVNKENVTNRRRKIGEGLHSRTIG